MILGDKKYTCEDIAGLFVFYLCNEVDEKERAAVEKHVAACASCRAQLLEEQSFARAIEAMPQPADQLDNAGIVLSQCRSELAEKLDDLVHPPVKHQVLRFGWVRRLMIMHPAWSGAALVALGLVLGTQSVRWSANRNESTGLDQAVNVRPSAQITDEQLAKMAVAGINFSPQDSNGMQNVRLQLNAEQPVTVSGNLDDVDVRRVMTYVVRNGQQFDSGLRLDCLDALRSRAQDKEVRAALLEVARKDQNPAVRLKALEALRDASNDRGVRQTLLETLQHDTNPGVRVEAVNLLVRSLEEPNGDVVAPFPGDEHLPAMPHPVPQTAAAQKEFDDSTAALIQALEELRHNDPSRYVRLQSSAALRQISDNRREH
jgi:HEAT repeats/Putative zinc-finger